RSIARLGGARRDGAAPRRERARRTGPPARAPARAPGRAPRAGRSRSPPRRSPLRARAARRGNGVALPRGPGPGGAHGVRVAHLVSCGGWPSDAYWAAQMCRETARAGHEATLICPAGSEARVMARARAEGVPRIETMTLRTGLRPRGDARDLPP